MTSYKRSFVAVHWVHALLLGFMLIGASLGLPDLPAKGGDLSAFKGHMILGVITTLVVALRLWMLRSQPEMAPLKVSSFRASLVRWNHRLIYLFIIIVGVSGLATAQSASLGQVLIFGSDASVYSGPEGITGTLGSVHGASTTILMILIAMHIAGVVSYRIKTGECILKRMWF